MIAATQIRVGMVIIYEGELCKVLATQHITQGNKRGKMQVEMRSLRTGNKLQYRFRSEDAVEKAVLSEKQMEYLYNDGDAYHFMDSTTFEQIQISKGELGNAVHYLKPNTKVTVEMHEERPIGVELPSAMELKVVDTPPAMKGATAAGGAKPATLDNGLTIKVPQFIAVGEIVRVNTETNEYVDRAIK
jgi:elongation factor P